MPSITSSVGDAATNKTHDVALVQAMLRVVKKNNVSYLAGNYDGSYGKLTKDAIIKFQNDYKLVHAKSVDKPGKIMPNGETLNKLNASLPQAYKSMLIIPDTKTVYLAGSAADAAASKTAITGKQDLDATFRTSVGQLVQNMYNQHKIVLKVTNSGWRRTFADQAAITNTKAGPGESNHNFGRAVDLGFRGFKWVQGNGTITQDNDWLSNLEAASNAKASAFWDKRDAIALKPPISLFRLNFERIHLQSYNQATVSSSRSLAALLSLVGTMKWIARYKSNLGKGTVYYPVGTAKQIWAGQSPVSKADIANAQGIPVAKVTAKDVKQMQTALKSDFEKADQNWKKWNPVP